MKMCDTARIKGWWFLPESPDHRVPGILTWSQSDGADLEVIGGLKIIAQPCPEESVQGEHSLFGGDPGEVTVFGETDAGKPVSLWGAERHRYTGDAFGNPREEYWHSAWACIGAHVVSAEAAELHDPVVALDNLYYMTADGRFCPPQWAVIEGVDRPGEQQADGTLVYPYILPVVGGLKSNVAAGSTSTVRYRVETHATRPWVSPATEAMPDLKLDFMTKRSRSGPSINVSVHARVRMEHDRAAWSAQEMLAALNPLGALMRLATFADQGVEFLAASNSEESEVTLLCQLGHESDPGAPVEAGGMVFTFADLDLATFLAAWDQLTVGPQATYAWNVVTGMVTHTPRLVEEGLSQVLAGAEGFHTWCLGEGSKPSLRERLTDLHGRLDESVAGVLQLDVATWVDWAVWARNHVDHGGSKKHRDIGGVHELKTISDVVRLVTYLATLGELSVPPGRVVAALREHPRLKVLVDRCHDIGSFSAPEMLQGD